VSRRCVMSWSWKIGRIAGIGVYVHFTFLILIAFLGIAFYQQTHSLAGVLAGMLLIACLFGIIVLHELGHALAARHYGIATRDITLLPIGGVARLERMPEKPLQELVVALAGPAVNVVLAVFFFVLAELGEGLAHDSRVLDAGDRLLDQLVYVNVMLVVFNLIPAFPMDGGRVLRALLATRMDYVRATQTAASIGQALALVFAFLGLFHNQFQNVPILGQFASPMLIFIALFVWMGASQEAAMVQLRSALSGIPVWRAMIRAFRTFSPQEPLREAVNGPQQDFLVVEDGRLVGVLCRHDLIQAFGRLGPEAPIGEVMRREFMVVDPGEMLDTVLRRLQEADCPVAPVVRGGELLGVVTLDSLSEVLRHAAADARRPPAGSPDAGTRT
jgi:Zn-dependent protease